MDLTLSEFYARFFGIYYLIFFILWVFAQEKIQSFIKEMTVTPGLLSLSGLISLLLGIAIVTSHPIYDLDWKGLITLIGYLAIIKGIWLIAFSKHAKKITKKMFTGQSFWIYSIIIFIIGIYLTFQGFSL